MPEIKKVKFNFIKSAHTGEGDFKVGIGEVSVKLAPHLKKTGYGDYASDADKNTVLEYFAKKKISVAEYETKIMTSTKGK